MPSGRKREPAPWSYTSGGVTKRPRQEDEPKKISASMMCTRHKQRRKRLSTRHSRSADPHAVQSTQQHCTMNRRCRWEDGMSRHAFASSSLAHASGETSVRAFPLPQRLHPGKLWRARAPCVMTAPPRPLEVDDRSRRRRVCDHFIQAALWAPTVGENDACLEVLVELQDWDENATARWPETSGSVMQNGAFGPEEPGTLTDPRRLRRRFLHQYASRPTPAT